MRKQLLLTAVSLFYLVTQAQMWAPVGTGMDNQVFALTTYKGIIYAGGSFTTAGGKHVSKLAKWNGKAWADGGMPVTSGGVNAFMEYNGELYAAGSFITTTEANR